MTNYEKIKNMSVEEVAMMIMCPYDGIDGFSSIECIEPKNCMQCTIEWLNNEVSE